MYKKKKKQNKKKKKNSKILKQYFFRNFSKIEKIEKIEKKSEKKNFPKNAQNGPKWCFNVILGTFTGFGGIGTHKVILGIFSGTWSFKGVFWPFWRF